MIAPFRRFFTSRERPFRAKAAGPGTHRPHRSRPALEALERRNLLSFLGPEHLVEPISR